MPNRAALFALALALSCGRAFGYQGGSLAPHNHSSPQSGGSSLSPVSVTASSGAFTVLSATGITSPGLWVLVSSAEVSGGAGRSSYTFSGLASSTSYRLEYDVVQQVAVGTFYLFPNGDTVANRCTVALEKSSGGTSAATGGTFTGCPLSVSNVGASAAFRGAADFHTKYGDISTLVIRTQSEDSSSTPEANYGGAYYSGSAFNRMDFKTSASTFTGTLFLYKRIDPAGYNLSSATSLGSNLPAHGHTSATDGGVLSSIPALDGTKLPLAGGTIWGTVTSTNVTTSALTISTFIHINSGGGIVWGDGSMTTAGSAAAVHFISTYTSIVANFATTQVMPPKDCIAGSTITWTATSSNDYEVIFNGTMSNDTLNDGTCIAVFVDGAVPIPYLTDGGSGGCIVATLNLAAGLYYPMSATQRIRGITAGAHSACLAIARRAGGTATLRGASGEGTTTSFEVREVP